MGPRANLDGCVKSAFLTAKYPDWFRASISPLFKEYRGVKAAVA